jgi:hypothetical protein
MRALKWNECELALSSIAPLMGRLARSPDAAFLYDKLSGGILWQDEFPDLRALRTMRNWSVIRFLFRFRTTLILGEPDDELRPCWEKAQQLFPSWPGFDPQRRSPELSAAVLEAEARSLSEYCLSNTRFE